MIEINKYAEADPTNTHHSGVVRLILGLFINNTKLADTHQYLPRVHLPNG